jgi:hypothetical protein
VDQEHHENPKQRLDRELMELLNELRVALPGVQVLFAFLLIVPFQQGFDRLSAGDTRVYYAGVVATAICSALLIAPTAHHRMSFRRGSKEIMVKSSNRLAIAGTFCLAVAMGTVVYVITSVLYGPGAARWVAGAIAFGTLLLWFAVPLLFRRSRDTLSEPSGEGGSDGRRGARPRVPADAGQP